MFTSPFEIKAESVDPHTHVIVYCTAVHCLKKAESIVDIL